jgi:hypothetical protein
MFREEIQQILADKDHPRTGHDGAVGEGYRYSSSLSSTSALDEGGWSKLHPSHFTPRKGTRYPLYRRLGGPQGRSGRVRKISPPQIYSACIWRDIISLKPPYKRFCLSTVQQLGDVVSVSHSEGQVNVPRREVPGSIRKPAE